MKSKISITTYSKFCVTTGCLSPPRAMTWCWTLWWQRMRNRRNGYRGRTTMLATKHDACFGLRLMMQYPDFSGLSHRHMSVRYTCHLQRFSVVSTDVQSIAWSPFFGGSAISYWIGVVSADIVGIGIIGHSFQSSLEIAIFHLMLMTSLLES